MKITRTCFECKKEFRKTDMVEYASLRAKTPHWYCRDCLIKKQERDRFSDKVCEIFGITQPGPRIWTERKRIQDTYGYTDDTIIRCLDYIYNTLGYTKLTESLCLVKPSMVNEMIKYENKKKVLGNQFVNAIQTEYKEYVVPIRENTKSNKVIWNPDDFLDD